jgi:hypothetical protein
VRVLKIVYGINECRLNTPQLTYDLKLHVTYTVRQFSQPVAHSSDISTKYLYSSLSLRINIETGCSDQNSNWCTVGTVGLTVSVTGERWGLL